jgi:hypothetical protein
MPKNWTTREIESVVTNPPGLKPRQWVLSCGLQSLHYNMGDMNNLTPNIRGDTTLQRLLTVKQTQKLQVWKLIHGALFGPLKQILSELKNF